MLHLGEASGTLGAESELSGSRPRRVTLFRQDGDHDASDFTFAVACGHRCAGGAAKARRRKRDYVRCNPRPDVATMLRQLPIFGKLVKKDLEIGFTEHDYAPPIACTRPTATTSSPRGVSAAYVTPRPETQPTDTPAPTPTPSLGPSETTLADGLKVQIIPQACISLATLILQKADAKIR